jgi:hypothetical protein
VPATANIFGAGRISPPASPGGVGTRPLLYTLPKGELRLLTFSSVTGEITCCKTGSNFFNGPAGRSDYATNLTGVRGVPGVKSRREFQVNDGPVVADLRARPPPTSRFSPTHATGRARRTSSWQTPGSGARAGSSASTAAEASGAAPSR